MERMFVARRSALARIVEIRRNLLDGWGNVLTGAETERKAAELHQLICDVRAGRVDEFVLHGERPVYIHIKA